MNPCISIPVLFSATLAMASATPAQISATWSTRIAGTSGANSGTGVVIFGAERTCVSLPGTSNALTIICP
jgi:hypothetical protein